MFKRIRNTLLRTLISPELRAKRLALREELLSQRKEHRRKLKDKRAYTDSEKIETVKTWLVLGGNTQLTAATTKVSDETIRLWRKQDWWTELENALRKEERLELSAKTKVILDKSIDQLKDRVENGDYVFDQKSGEIRRKPVSAKDLLKITVDMIDRKELLDRNSMENVKPESNEDKLAELAKRFEEIANKINKKPSVEVTDVVFVEDKRTVFIEESK
jgi:hypothetical protein